MIGNPTTNIGVTMTKKTIFLSKEDYDILYDRHGRAPTKAEKEAYQTGKEHPEKQRKYYYDGEEVSRYFKWSRENCYDAIVNNWMKGLTGGFDENGHPLPVKTRYLRDGVTPAPVLEIAPPGSSPMECVATMERNGVPEDTIAPFRKMAERAEEGWLKRNRLTPQ